MSNRYMVAANRAVSWYSQSYLSADDREAWEWARAIFATDNPKRTAPLTLMRFQEVRRLPGVAHETATYEWVPILIGMSNEPYREAIPPAPVTPEPAAL